MRIVFAGTPEFAATILASLIDAAPAAGWNLPLVWSQPDRPAGRGLRRTPSPVKQLALASGISVDSPVSLRKGDDADAALDRLREAMPDLLVVAAYGLILPQPVLDVPRGILDGAGNRLTAINVHASLLPRWRGAAPVVRAIEAGDAITGVTLMQMEAGLDTGPMLCSEAITIEPTDTAGALTHRLAAMGGRLLVDALRNPQRLVALPQPDHATYAAKIGKFEAAIDWALPAEAIERKLRAFDPFPVATSEVRGTVIRLWRARVGTDLSSVRAHAPPPGTVIGIDDGGIAVACGRGALTLTELQRPGSRRMNAREFLRGFALEVGDQFVGSPATAPEAGARASQPTTKMSTLG